MSSVSPTLAMQYSGHAIILALVLWVIWLAICPDPRRVYAYISGIGQEVETPKVVIGLVQNP
jgi:hypothetical protein